jgi:hypothetical protein
MLSNDDILTSQFLKQLITVVTLKARSDVD